MFKPITPVTKLFEILKGTEIKKSNPLKAASKSRAKKRGLLAVECPLAVLAFRDYLDTCSPAIENGTGDNTTYQVAVTAYNLGLSEETTFALMKAYFNDRCDPPWEDKDLRKKIENAFSYAQGEHGETLDTLQIPDGRLTAAPFPKNTLPPLFRAAADSIHAITQAPYSIGVQSLLAVASLVAQAFVNVQLPFGAIKPASLFLVTIAASGERKTACDELAMEAIRKREEELCQDYRNLLPLHNFEMEEFNRHQKALKQAATDRQERRTFSKEDKEPEKPLEPIITAEEPTIEAVSKLLVTAQPSLGLFSSEGGQFLGGYSMSKENRMRTIAGFSKLWDGSPTKRIRSGDGNTLLDGKRFSLHLMIQPGAVTENLLRDGLSQEQGFLARCLITQPESTMGQRLYRDVTESDNAGITAFTQKILELLRQKPPLKLNTRNELEPNSIPLNNAAKASFQNFHDEIEQQIGEGGLYHPISGFANKLPEMACRLALILAFIENPELEALSDEHLSWGIDLARYYLSEA